MYKTYFGVPYTGIAMYANGIYDLAKSEMSTVQGGIFINGAFGVSWLLLMAVSMHTSLNPLRPEHHDIYFEVAVDSTDA